MRVKLVSKLMMAGILGACLNPGGAAQMVFEVEDLAISNAEVQELEGASGKVVVFEEEGAEATGEVTLERGVYRGHLEMLAPNADSDAVHVTVGEQRSRVYPPTHGELSESSEFTVQIEEAGTYPLSVTLGEPGALVDRVLLQLMPGEAVADLSEKESDRAYTDLYPTDAIPGPTDGRTRVIVTSDGEIDDECSLVRFMLYANEWDVEAIISSSSQYHAHGHNWAGDDWADPYLAAYAEVYPNLVKHDPRYPTPEYLLARTLLGNVKAEGEMEAPTAGSEYIVKVLRDRSDDEPVWLQAWGGTNTIARALKTIQDEHPEDMEYVAGKMRFFFIWEQDPTYQEYIRPNWEKYEIPTIISDQFWAIAYQWDRIQPEEQQAYLRGDWMKANILEGHGALCSLYEAHDDGRFRSEGDSPAFLHVIPNGLRSDESPGWGGWGGRYHRLRANVWLDPVPQEGYEYPEGRWYTRSAWGRSAMRRNEAEEQELRTEYFKPIWRWTAALQNDFAARTDWCVKPYEEANHPPVVRLGHDVDLTAKPGETVRLSAEGTIDPDGDELSYKWWRYGEASTYQGRTGIENTTHRDATLSFSNETGEGGTIHVICEVTDAGSPPLTRYQRVVVTVE